MLTPAHLRCGNSRGHAIATNAEQTDPLGQEFR